MLYLNNIIVHTMKTSSTLKRRTLREVPKDPSQRNIPALFPRRKALRKSLAPSYIPIAHHVYYDGSSFRVRVRTEGRTTSWNTSDKRTALEYRDYLILSR
jgi:hypothetical protein